MVIEQEVVLHKKSFQELTVDELYELLGRDEFNACIFNVSAMNGLGVGMLTQ